MIAIIGGGIAGLIAAINLEKAGYDCTIFEKNKRLGGRLRTDLVEGLPLDHGFQVLLTEYPYAQKYLDYSALNLVNFNSGAVIFKNGKGKRFGNPIRNLAFLFPTLFSNVATFQDKKLVYNLGKYLNSKSIESIFKSPSLPTIDYLKQYGFSDQIIFNFFKPFFGGIFLEEELKTSSRLFEFVFKMFNQGHAAVPKLGMQSIPHQLRGILKKTKIVLGTTAQILDNGSIMVHGKENQVQGIVKAYGDCEDWHGSTTNYYRVSNRILKGQIIGLLAEKNTIINNFYYVNDKVVSVTSLDTFKPEIMDQKMREELKSKLNIQVESLIKSYKIPKSLPVVNDIGENERSGFRMLNTTPMVEAGDYLYYGALNAAMHSGEVAANNLIDHLN